jgi:formamidopyrimidine-DNA glycosylase
MPELPEVEIVTRRLHQLIAGQTISRARLFRKGLAPEHTPRQFQGLLRAATIREVTRRGKHILAHLSNGRTLITHLRMTGRFFYLPEDADPTPHMHAAFWFAAGTKLLFDDQRHFGMMLVAPTDELDRVKPLVRLAPEPFSPAFTPESLHATLRRSRQPIKLALLDQTKVLGLGNIYAAEALHRAGIHPQLSADRLSKPRAGSLHREIVAVLGEAIANDVAFDGRYGDLDASYGRYETLARVYEREDQPCLACNTAIRRITQGGRSTYFCPRCQRR